LVALLERFYDVDGGKVLFDGADIRSLDVRWLRLQIGLVSQEPVLFSGSVGWNISLGRDGASRSDIEAAADMANAGGFVKELPEGYDTLVGEHGMQLSGGQKQRVAIARALIRDPAVLVLDEATSALDTESERIVHAALDRLMAAHQRTNIVIAHRLSTIQKADKICVFSEGAVVEEGTHEALLQKESGIYRALVLHDRAGKGESLS
jgi:ATP-binding cassette subfamily B (MDR/TAP) protein 1